MCPPFGQQASPPMFQQIQPVEIPTTFLEDPSQVQVHLFF
jgi:hypothetical protein